MGKTFFCKHTWIRDQLIGRDTFSRQNDAGSDEIESTDITGPGAEAAAAGDNEIRCVPKVMQVGTLFQNDIFLILDQGSLFRIQRSFVNKDW